MSRQLMNRKNSRMQQQTNDKKKKYVDDLFEVCCGMIAVICPKSPCSHYVYLIFGLAKVIRPRHGGWHSQPATCFQTER